MADYKELAEKMRRCASRFSCVSCEDFGACELVSAIFRKAADAIVELSKYANTMRRLKCEGWYLQQNKYHDGYTAVATMPLPEPPTEEQT